ncbi:hypothetical protein [Microbacterium jepli]
MTFLSRGTIEQWVEEFRSSRRLSATTVFVMRQDGAAGANTGLVGVQLTHPSVTLYMEPESPSSETWLVTFEPREMVAVLDAASVARLSAELATTSEL